MKPESRAGGHIQRTGSMVKPGQGEALPNRVRIIELLLRSGQASPFLPRPTTTFIRRGRVIQGRRFRIVGADPLPRRVGRPDG